MSQLNKRDGSVRWLYDIQADGNQRQFHGDPLVADKQILYGTDGADIGHVYAFDLATGEVIWKVASKQKSDLGAGFPTDIVRDENLVYAVDMREEIVAIDLTTGAVQWRYSIGAPKWLGTSPAVAHHRLYFGSRNSSLCTLDAVTGKLLWKRDFGAPICATPVVIGDDVVVGTSDGEVYRLSPNGKVRSQLTLHDRLVSRPGMFNGNLILMTRRKLMAVDSMLHKILWSRESTTDWSSPNVREFQGSLLVGNEAGELIAFDPRTGTTRWTKTIGKSPVRGIGSDGEMLYAGNYAGDLVAIKP